MKIEQLYKIFKDSKHGSWIVDFGDFEKLSEFIKRNNILSILELGGGAGACTSILAESVGSQGHVHSVEAFKKCIQISKRLIPIDLQKRITFYNIDVDVIQIPGILDKYFLSFSNLPDNHYDMVVIDGPGPVFSKKAKESGYLFKLPGGDFFKLIQKTEVGTFFYVDGRKEMVNLMIRFFSDYLRLLVTSPNHAIFIQTKKIVGKKFVLNDLLLRDLSRRGYFNYDENFISSDK